MKFQKAARPLVMSRNGIVSAGHYLGALAGIRILQEGGNAVDAALAAAFAMPVVKPETSGPGGDVRPNAQFARKRTWFGRFMERQARTTRKAPALGSV